MAAKRKTTKRKPAAKSKAKKSAPKTPKAPSPLVQKGLALAMIVVSALIFIGGFEWGGVLPISLFNGVAWAFGYVAYFFVPMTLIYLAIQKLKHEDNLMPLPKLLSSIIGLIAIAGLIHIFADQDITREIAVEGRYGGFLGYLASIALLSALNSVASFIILAIIAFLATVFTFEISVKQLFRTLIERMRMPEKAPKADSEDILAPTSSLAELRGRSKFKLNKGVPVENHDEPELKPSPRKSSFRNSTPALETSHEPQVALTIETDPDWKYPSVDLLDQSQDKADAGDVQENAEIIRETLANFNIDAEMEGANIGPRVTQYTLRPPSGTKLTKITSLESNIALDLAAQAIRIEAPIPGKRAVGIEVPNKKSATVRLSSVLMSKEWKSIKPGGLAFSIGKDIAGNPEVGELHKMPHLLIAGQTGSGKSVMINSLLTSLLYHNAPSDMKLILVDPKQVELTPYHDIPHLLTPVITEPEKCISALKWSVAEMERRLRTFADAGKRSIAEYNNIPDQAHMPYIVIVIDELADLMMMAARDVEALIVRIAQKARAAGIHLVLATQRPSVDVITGLIKANVPARIAFTVASQVDSRTIIDGMGAEKLLGMGDMLYKTSAMPKPKRVQGAWIDEDETLKVCDFLRMQRPPQYDDEIVSQPVQLNGKGGVVAPMDTSDTDDDMWRDAIQVVVDGRKASTSLLQRRLRIGYARAARIMESMEEQGIIGQADGSRPREVLVNSVDEVFGGIQAAQEDYAEEIDTIDDGTKHIKIDF